MKINEHRLKEIIQECIDNVILEMSPVRSNRLEFIQKAMRVHGDKYDYSKVSEYINNKEKVDIICKIHGVFPQRPKDHLDGHGCPLCRESHLEKITAKALKDAGVVYDRNFKPIWLNKLSLDFFIPSKNIAIECQGIQHFQPVPFFGGEKRFARQQKNDQIKADLCKTNGIKLAYIYYYDKNIIGTVQKILSDF